MSPIPLAGRLAVPLLLVLAAGAASAQSMTLVRQAWGEYAFEMRVDTTGADCADLPAAPARLFAPDSPRSVPGCGSGRWLTLRFRGTAVDSLDGPMVWLGAEPDTVAMERASAGPPYPATAPVPAGAIRDLTGDGVPEVVVSSYSGGMHCCTTHWIVTLAADGPRPVARLDAADGQAEIADLDRDGTPEIVVADWSFAYWNTSFAESPAPRVVLRWDGARFAPTWRGLRWPPIDIAALDTQTASVRADAAWAERQFPPAAYWATLLDLLYAGHGGEAARFAEDAWDGDAVGRRVFLRWLGDMLYQSPYGSAVADLNRDAVDWL
jgi:hypothetical protein